MTEARAFVISAFRLSKGCSLCFCEAQRLTLTWDYVPPLVNHSLTKPPKPAAGTIGNIPLNQSAFYSGAQRDRCAGPLIIHMADKLIISAVTSAQFYLRE